MNDQSSFLCEIPYSINSLQKEEIYKIKVDNIYDPSKFWVTIHIKERSLFEHYLTDFYKEKKMAMGHYHIKKYTNCIVCRNSRYYRAVIMPAVLQEKNKFRVFLVDCGQIVNVDIKDLFYIFKQHCNVPRFAIRASLFGISPLNQSESWSLCDVQNFLELISDKEVYARIKDIDELQKTLYLELYAIKDTIKVCINTTMIQDGFASYSKSKENSKDHKLCKYRCKVKYIHLCPSFNAIERGLVPCSLWEQKMLKDVPLDLLYKPYYEFTDIQSHICDSLVE